MNKCNLSITLLVIMLFSCDTMKKPEQKSELTPVADRMDWWREARFGMFIHWGLYAIPAGEWNGERIPGISEWIMLRAEIPVNEYKALAQKFNPVKYDAEQWVRLAKEAGMKYIVITSKHHDGFAMFDSDAHDFNIVDATPFDRDPIEELAEACRRHDMKLGFYHSQAQDWTHPGGTYRGIEQDQPHWDPEMQRVPLMQYIEEKAYPQVRELLTRYGDVAIMWWDTPVGMTIEAADTLHSLLSLQPGIIENNRLYRPWPGDFSTPEQHIPPTGLDYDWEVCMTMNTSWGYKWYDNNWKSSATLIRNLVDITSKGGNYLLNVGPTAEGLIPEESVERLEAIGGWMKDNGTSIYGTEASPFFKLFWGRCTQKATERGTTLYLHVFDWPSGSRLSIPGLNNQVTAARLLTSGETLPYARQSGAWVLEVPENAPDPINTVIVLEIEGTPDVTSNMPVQNDDGAVELPARMGFIHNRGYGEHARLTGTGPDAHVTNWVEPRARVQWMFEITDPGSFAVSITYRAEKPSRIKATIGSSSVTIDLPVTPSSGSSFDTVVEGQIDHIPKGTSVLEMSPAGEAWQAVELRAVRLLPAEE